ncbi:glucose 1-dehydrogenase [Methylobacterium sp. ID0610]|uniref:glucose 1-dehydrogenase n=1 Tax=Methylobacterium carpenticola TaxID=3344827 RepID=UPI00368975E9
MDRVKDKVAIVTGAAKGIGEATARLLAGEGASVVITDLDVSGGERIVQEIGAHGGRALFLCQDVTDEDGWVETIAATVKAFGKLSILVNNAGVALSGSVEDTTIEDWRKLMAVNLDAVFLGTKHAIGAMRTFGGGSIINLSSIEGIVGDPNLAAYNASKGGVRLLTKSAALHCAKTGSNIRVNSVHPGFIWTPMVENYLSTLGDLEEGREATGRLHPVGHLGEPIDIAAGILYLASDESKFMTGAELVIDGGFTAQ